MNQQTRRVLDYLWSAENRETDPWLKDDLRQAWICLRFAARRVPNPFVLSSYAMYGIHPDQLPAKIEARRRAQLGSYYEIFHGSSSPKKPVRSERDPKWREKKSA